MPSRILIIEKRNCYTSWFCAIPFFISVFLSTFPASADTCQERCQRSYESCAAVKAAGCKIGGAVAGKAAEQLGSMVPIPGMGSLFGSVASNVSEDQCKKLLAPCEEIRTNCLKECGPEMTPGAQGSVEGIQQTIVIQQESKPEKKVGTLRVFSDHPRTVVYLNEQRMGVTPEDVLQPFISPEMRIGKYWVKLVTSDNIWLWEGEKDLEEGNVNAVEGMLVNQVNLAWNEAQEKDTQNKYAAALLSFERFIEKYPRERKRVRIAKRRIRVLKKALSKREKELLNKIRAANINERKIELCSIFLLEFPDSIHIDEVRSVDDHARYQYVLASNDLQIEIERYRNYIDKHPQGFYRKKLDFYIEQNIRQAILVEKQRVSRLNLWVIYTGFFPGQLTNPFWKKFIEDFDQFVFSRIRNSGRLFRKSCG